MAQDEIKGAGESGTDAEEFFQAGVFLLKRGRPKEALTAFRRALSIKDSEPRYLSYCGLCMARSGESIPEAVELCERAVRREFFRADLFLNLGKVYLMSGNRMKAHQAFRKARSLEQENTEVRQELQRMGVRKPPPLPFLDRGHPLNKIAGKMLHKMRLR